MPQIPFPPKDIQLARTLLEQGAIKSTVFSEGTYQVEVSLKKKSYWPFLQMNDKGDLSDAFCSCSSVTKKTHCAHLAAAYLSIFRGFDEPLHVRFRTSLWNRLCWIASRRHGYRTDCLEKNGRYEAKSLTGKLLFSLTPIQDQGRKKVEELIDCRIVETEETSLKFSNLDPEEIALWKQGRPSEKLKYELSFWSDLAKWCFVLQDAEDPYQIEFLAPEGGLPKWIEIRFSTMHIGFYISKGNWPLIIPSLSLVRSPLSVHETIEKEIQSIEYDPIRQQISLHFVVPKDPKLPSFTPEECVELEGWKFAVNQGFFRSKRDPIFEWDHVPKEKIGDFLTHYTALLRCHLQDRIFEGEYPLQYHLSFDENHCLHIEMFLQERGDLQQEGAAFFGRWIYKPHFGFYPIQNPLFPEVDTIIPSEEVGNFVSRHKSWLNHFEGFQIHLMTMEPEISYLVDEEASLHFYSEMEESKDLQGITDFGEWIFIPGKGFFPKRREKMIPTLKSGKKVQAKEIPIFLRTHKEELSLLPRFFSEKNPMAQFSLEVSLLENNSIHIRPIFSLLPEYQKKRVLFFQEYAYVEGEGFSKFLLLHPFLEEYAMEKTLTSKEEHSFLSRLATLIPWITKIDPRLKLPKSVSLHLEDMARQQEGKASLWELNLQYETNLGSVDLFDVWKAVQSHQRFFFTEAGMLDLSGERFQWLKSVPKKKWGPGGKTLVLSAMEWIRIQMQEPITTSSDSQVQKAFEEFHTCQGFLPCHTEGLKSDLRPYQETGLKWLWFLYSYGLSGLLCDEMGLGKTHQAMALLAAVSSSDESDKKFLIVCPTSVIYHWEDLLKRFLPHLQVFTFHGQSRHREDLMDKAYHVLLTSYGVMRSERKALSQISFDVAIYDEVQNAKNTASQTHKALASLQSYMKLGLTGTPIENHVMELKALFDLILPHYLPSDAQFREKFLIPMEREQDIEKKELLSKLVKPFILRRKKSEVLLELPEKIEEIAYCDLSAEQKTLYRDLFFSQKTRIEMEMQASSDAPTVMHVFSLLSKLKQICNHPCLFSKDKENFLHHSSGKWDLFVELLQEARESGHKVVVFTQYLDMMDMIETYLEGQGIGFAEIRGSSRDRREALSRFKEDPECVVFVASLQAAGVGIDLTAASVVIHYDRWWNPAREDQATDRVHRMGQSRGVQVFKLVTKKSVEEKIHALILKKKGILDEVVGFDEQDVVKKLTKQEIFELLSSLEKDLQGE